MYKYYQQFNSIFKQSPNLNKLANKVANLEQLNSNLKSCLDSQLAQNCCVANLDGSSLIIAVSSPAWKHQLRFSQMDILTKLRKNPSLAGLSNIKIIVQPPSANLSKKNNKIPSKMSHNSAKLLEETAELSSSDKLKKALKNLASKWNLNSE